MPVILTGDIVNSSRFPASIRQERLNVLLDSLFNVLKLRWPQQVRAEMVQGDAFQIFLAEQAEGLHLLLAVKSFFLSQDQEHEHRLDCRLSLGLGEVDFLHTTSLAKSGGEAFEYSGRGLKSLPADGSRMTFQSSDAEFSQTLIVMLALTEEITKRWTVAQSEAIVLRLLNPADTQEQLAQVLGISRPAFSQRLGQTGWPALEKLLGHYSAMVKLRFNDQN